MKRVYLDFAAATPVDPAVVGAMLPFFGEQFYNPSALYQGARDVKQALEESRASVAQALGARPSEIIFTAGGTESINLAIHGVMRGLGDAYCVLSAIEHDAVLKTASSYDHTIAQVSQKGIVDTQNIEASITDKTVLVSVMLANNEVGTVQPIKQIADVVDRVRRDRLKRGVDRPIYFHTDAAQAPLFLDVHVGRLGVDLLTLNGGKIHGPKQSGILYVKTGSLLTPQITGGGQEFGLRSGTENVPFAIGFAKALQLAGQNRQERVKRVSALRDQFMKSLEEMGGVINGHRSHRLANNVHVTFPGRDNERMLFSLDDQGVDAAAGSACSASKETSSHVLLAMGHDDDYARSSLRLTLGQATTKDDVGRALTALQTALDA